MVDMVSYVGDMLSFYLDYQANESFLQTSTEYANILKHGKALGYKFDYNATAYGTVSLFVDVAATANGLGVDTTYIPILEKGSTFSSTNGNIYTLNEDVDFSDASNEVVVGSVNNTTGLPTTYIIRAFGQILSGDTKSVDIKVNNFERFKRVPLNVPNMAEIISVTDSAGNQYHEVDYLSQNMVYRPITNTGEANSLVPNLLRPVAVPRRFVMERELGNAYLQFGYGSESEISKTDIMDPSNVALRVTGRDFITESSFDPTKLLQTDKFGVAPANTTLRVVYRENSRQNVNAGANTIIIANTKKVKFKKPDFLSSSKRFDVVNSIEVTNDEPIVGDITFPSSDEIKRRIFDSFAAQNRAVTAQDYKAITYMMPAKFGAIKRCNVVQDNQALKRNLNLYVVSEDQNGNLSISNPTIKQNLKNWLNQYRMINDTVDILDAKIINIGIDFEIVAELDKNKFEALSVATQALRDKFLQINEIGEPINIGQIYKTLNVVNGVSDTVNVSLRVISGGRYSSSDFNINDNLSPDGRLLIAPNDSIFEIRYISEDIKGAVR